MLVKWGSIIVKGSGKLGGHVFSSGQSGASVHTSARARNPQTLFQQNVRSRFTKLTQAWRDLTEGQRESWYDAESSFSRANRFGDVVTLSGKNLFESLNINRQIIGLAVLNTAPLPSEIPKNRVDVVEIDQSLGTISIKGEFASSQKYVIVGTKGLSQGVRESQDELRRLGITNSEFDGGQIRFIDTQYSRYVGRFGLPIVGRKIFIGTYSISTSGQRSPNSVVQAVFV